MIKEQDLFKLKKDAIIRIREQIGETDIGNIDTTLKISR